MQILSFDLSSHTGWSLFEEGHLKEYGLLEIAIKDYKAILKSHKDFVSAYPLNLATAAQEMTALCMELIDKYPAAHIVTEHTVCGKNVVSQRFLEFLHYVFTTEIHKRGRSFKYLMNSDWRIHNKVYLKHWPEHQAWNKTVSKLKKSAKPTKSGAKVAKLDGKIVTKIDQKDLSILIANQTFNLNLDDDNIADSVLLGKAAHEMEIFT